MEVFVKGHMVYRKFRGLMFKGPAVLYNRVVFELTIDSPYS